jgi:predicted PurR-regulated permease PerM
MRSSPSQPRVPPSPQDRQADAVFAGASVPRIILWFYGLGAVVLGWLILEKSVAYLLAAGTATATAVGALFLAYFMHPVVHRLNLRLPLWTSITIPYATCAIIVALGLWLFVPRLFVDAQSLIAALPQFESAEHTYLAAPSDPIFTRISPPIRLQIANAPQLIIEHVQHNGFGLAGWALETMKSAVDIAILTVAVPVASIYMLTEAEKLKRFVLGMIPGRFRDRAIALLGDLNIAVGGYIRGQLMVAATVGFLASLLLIALRVPYGLLIGLWAGIADVVPYVGPFMGAVPGIALALYANGPVNGLLVLGGFVLINQLEAHVLLPRIIARTVNLTPLTVIIALIAGGEMLGLPGLLLAVPIAGAARVLLQHVRPPEPLINQEVRPALTHVPRTELDPEATDA